MAQGFEIDYIGVIIGKDIVYDTIGDVIPADASATADPTLRNDKDGIEMFVKTHA
jgi:DUF2075 family protein